jgi:hypothetical protein
MIRDRFGLPVVPFGITADVYTRAFPKAIVVQQQIVDGGGYRQALPIIKRDNSQTRAQAVVLYRQPSQVTYESPSKLKYFTNFIGFGCRQPGSIVFRDSNHLHDLIPSLPRSDKLIRIVHLNLPLIDRTYMAFIDDWHEYAFLIQKFDRELAGQEKTTLGVNRLLNRIMKLRAKIKSPGSYIPYGYSVSPSGGLLVDKNRCPPKLQSTSITPNYILQKEINDRKLARQLKTAEANRVKIMERQEAIRERKEEVRRRADEKRQLKEDRRQKKQNEAIRKANERQQLKETRRIKKEEDRSKATGSRKGNKSTGVVNVQPGLIQ